MRFFGACWGIFNTTRERRPTSENFWQFLIIKTNCLEFSGIWILFSVFRPFLTKFLWILARLLLNLWLIFFWVSDDDCEKCSKVSTKILLRIFRISDENSNEFLVKFYREFCKICFDIFEMFLTSFFQYLRWVFDESSYKCLEGLLSSVLSRVFIKNSAEFLRAFLKSFLEEFVPKFLAKVGQTSGKFLTADSS